MNSAVKLKKDLNVDRGELQEEKLGNRGVPDNGRAMFRVKFGKGNIGEKLRKTLGHKTSEANLWRPSATTQGGLELFPSAVGTPVQFYSPQMLNRSHPLYLLQPVHQLQPAILPQSPALSPDHRACGYSPSKLFFTRALGGHSKPPDLILSPCGTQLPVPQQFMWYP